MAEPARADTATATGPATLSLKEGVASLLQGEADQRKADTRGRQEPDPANDNVAGAQDPEDGAVDTDDESTDDTDREVEPADDEQPEDRVEEEPVHTVRIDGKEHKVTLTELLKGYSRQADYTRRTTALAAKAREAEEATTRASAEREQYRQALEILQRGLTEGVQEPDWATLERTDPIEFLRQKEIHRDRRERIAQLQAEEARVRSEQEREAATKFRGYLETQRSQLLEKIPIWRDPAKAAAERKALRDYATETLGYTAEEIAQAFDHRLIVMLRKAWLYDRVSAKGALVDKRVRTAPTELPSRARQIDGQGTRAGTAARAKQMARLTKTGDIRDAVGLLLMEQPKNA